MTIDRHSPFWEQCFLIAYRTLADRVPTEEKTLAGPALAKTARFLADDCLRVRDATDLVEPHGPCAGVGCAECFWTGDAHAKGPLVAPPDKSVTIPIARPAPGELVTPEPDPWSLGGGTGARPAPGTVVATGASGGGNVAGNVGGDAGSVIGSRAGQGGSVP